MPIIQNPDDEAWEKLLDSTTIDSNTAKAKQQAAGMSKQTWHELRVRAKRDLFFLATAILGYDRLSINLHGHMCEWMETNKHERFRLVLLPRGHFKSTVVTISNAIRCALPYTDEDKKYDHLAESDPITWPDSLGTNGRILIAHETHGSASRYLFSITNHFLTNPILMALFPDAIPNPRVHRINKTELELPRTKIWNEPTFDTMGVGGKAQGRHYNKFFLDDLIGDKARDSETEMSNSKEWFDNIQSFFSVFKIDTFDMVGTRWSNDDLYAHAMERYGSKLKVYCRPVEELNEKTGLKVPIFQEEFTTESLNILRKNRKVFSAQYENDPDSGNTRFQESWIKYFGWQTETVIAPFDGPRKGGRLLNIRDCNVCFLIDPAVSGLGGFNVTGTDEQNRTFVFKSEQEEWSPPVLTDKIFKEVQYWHPRIVCIEEVLFSELYRHWWETEMKVRGVRFRIVPYSAKQQQKNLRVEALSNPLSAGQLFFNETYYSKGQDPLGKRSDLIYQIVKFGTIKDYHALDALSQGPEVWTPGFKREALEELKKQELERKRNRSPLTGYSA